MRVLLILLCLSGAGCAATAEGGQRFTGTEWRASDLNGVPVGGGSIPTLRLDSGKQVSGNAGCNRFSGTYELMRDEGIRFSSLTTTRMACAPEVMDQEQRYLSILGSVRGYSFYSDGGMSLISPDGRAIRFRR
jgi:heat shock protein HslJ